MTEQILIADETRRAGKRTLTTAAAGTAAVLAAAGIAALLAQRRAQSPSNTFENFMQSLPGDFFNWSLWVIGDWSEPTSYKSPLASLGLLLGAAIAWLLWRNRNRAGGFPISYGFGRLVPAMFVSAGTALLLSNLIFRDLLTGGLWQPTFVVIASVPTAVVLIYGGAWSVVITGAVLGTATVPGLSLLLINTVCIPAGIPNVVGIVTAMGIGGLVSFTLCRLLPWMRRQQRPQPDSTPVPPARGQFSWTIRRILADFSEAQFIGNEWAGALLITGVCLGFALDPGFVGYGLKLLPEVLVAQVLSSAVGVLLWRHWYENGGWAATYVPVVSAAPTAVVLFDGSLPGILVGGVIGGVLGAPIARFLSRLLPANHHPYIANVFSMALTTLAVTATVPILHP